MKSAATLPSSRPPTWAIVLAFTLVYLSWGTTYFAIRQGVHFYHLPPGLFGGVRVGCAGMILLAFLGLRGETIRLWGRELLWVTLSGLMLFVGGNGLITVAMDKVPSGMASVLVATTPLWMALMETLWPRGDRLSARGWLGLLVGLGGVLLLLAPKLVGPDGRMALPDDYAPCLVLGSAMSWALGALVVRYHKPAGSHLVAAAYQMVLGGGTMTVLALALGEGKQVVPELSTAGAWLSFLYLLIVGSLVGFVAFNWLLGHVPASLVGTYAYVNPLVAILVGRLLGGEELTGWILGGMFVILTGVALVRGARVPAHRRVHDDECPGLRSIHRETSLAAPKAIPMAASLPRDDGIERC